MTIHHHRVTVVHRVPGWVLFVLAALFVSLFVSLCGSIFALSELDRRVDRLESKQQVETAP